MENSPHHVTNTPRHKLAIFGVSAIAIISMVVGAYGYLTAVSEKQALSERLSQLEDAFKNTSDSLTRSEQERSNLITQLNAAGQQNKSFADQLDKVSTTIETYERLSRIDPELLQKYSKVYFLNENYTPSALTDIDTKYLFIKDRPLQTHDRVWSFLRDMLEAATQSNIDLKVVSGYRSFGTQATLKSTYKVTYGAGTANSFSAEQGYSEHQLGTAIDFTTQKVGSSLAGFEKTDSYTWLMNNAYRYGFILSYPKNNSYYVYEPWHWRFVGLELAQRLHDEGKYFYDLDQRDISSYLANVFILPKAQ